MERTAGSVTNVSNLLSIGRLLLTAPAIVVVLGGQKDVAVMLFVMAALSDFLDGWFARRMNQASDLGRVLDPLADKIFVAGVAVALLLGGYVPLWFVLPVLVRDVLILVGGIYVKAKSGVLLESNWTGKWTVGAISFAALIFYLELNVVVETGFAILALVMVAVSFVLYARTAMKTVRSPTT
jgi:CDP-diacylglycerol--glycerol-3-phosphate 3-phosphatidyltransferase